MLYNNNIKRIKPQEKKKEKKIFFGCIPYHSIHSFNYTPTHTHIEYWQNHDVKNFVVVVAAAAVHVQYLIIYTLYGCFAHFFLHFNTFHHHELFVHLKFSFLLLLLLFCGFRLKQKKITSDTIQYWIRFDSIFFVDLWPILSLLIILCMSNIVLFMRFFLYSFIKQ